MRDWPDRRTTSLTAEQLLDGQWPAVEHVMLRPLPNRNEEQTAGFIKDFASLAEGVTHPWKIHSYPSFAAARKGDALASRFWFDRHVNPSVLQNWDKREAAKASWPSVDKTHHVAVVKGKAVQHHADNIQLLDVMSNKAKYASPPLAADLVNYATLIWNGGQPAIGEDRAKSIVDAVAAKLNEIHSTCLELRTLTPLGQDNLEEAVNRFGLARLAACNEVVKPLPRKSRRIPVSSEVDSASSSAAAASPPQTSAKGKAKDTDQTRADADAASSASDESDAANGEAEEEDDESPDSPDNATTRAAYLAINRKLSSDEVVAIALAKGVSSRRLQRFSEPDVQPKVLALLKSILGDDVGESTVDGTPTLRIWPKHWSWEAISACLLYWILLSDDCDDKRPVCPPPPVGPILEPVAEPPIGPVRPPTEPVDPVKPPLWSNDERQRIKACFEQDFRNSVHFMAFLAIRFGTRGPQRDHVTALPLDLWADGIDAVTRIGHRVHGLCFCFGFPMEFPETKEDFVELACNVQVERRSTNWWRGARRGAALWDWLQRHKPWLQQFQQGKMPLPDDALLSDSELGAIVVAPVGFAETVDRLMHINVFSQTEQAVWYRSVYGPVTHYAQPVDIESLPATGEKHTRAWRIQSLLESGEDLPWRLKYSHAKR